MNKLCVIIIPIYKSLSDDDIMVIHQAIKMTPGFTIKYVAPLSFNTDDTFKDFESIQIERFDDIFFKSIQGYNRLMMNIDFYKRFQDYKYMLIHHTDAYLFREELSMWCNKGYDYIGAPWYIPRKLPKYNLYKFLFRYCKPLFKRDTVNRWRHFNVVGNGGLSLRKINSFIEVLTNANKSILDMYLKNETSFFNEDIFWSIDAPEIKKDYKSPIWDEALSFAFEVRCDLAYEYKGNKLPFGCHAFNKFDTDFWKQFIPFKDVIEVDNE